MSGTKEYKIVINGITESVNAVDSLLKKLDTLEQRIDAISQKQATVSTASGGSGGGSSTRKSDLSEEAKLVDQITRLQEKRNALETEWGKQLMDEKQAMKELTAEQKSLAAKDRLAAGGYDSNTMLGMKAELADLKAAMQTMEVGSDEFLKAAERANQLNDALKNIEQTYGQYGRNVGNYSNSIVDALEQITVKIGNQEVKFNSAREASRTLQNQMRNMAIEGKEDTEEYKNMANALHDVSLATARANDEIAKMQSSSPVLHELLETFQSFGAIGQITQGFSSMFGNTGLEESIQKLMALQSAMNGLKTLSDQLNTGSGLGGIFSKGSRAVDTFVSKITGAKVGMNGLTASTKTATTAVRLLSAAFKTLGIGLLIAALTEALDLFKQLGSWLGITASDAADNVDATNEVTNAIERENKELEKNLLLIKLKETKGEITSEEAKKQRIEETTKAIEEQTQKMMEQMNLEDDREKKNLNNRTGKQDVLEGYGSWEIDPSKIEDATMVWNKFNVAVGQGKDIFASLGMEWDSWWATAAKTADSQIDLSQKVLFNFITETQSAMNDFKNGVDGSKEKLTELISKMNDPGIINSIVSRLDEFIPSEAVRARIKQIIGSFQSLGGLLGVNTVDDEIKKTQDAIAKAEADAKKRAAAAAAAAKKSAKTSQRQTIDVEKETQKMKLDLMEEGYLKEVEKLKQERDDLLKRYKNHRELMKKANELYDKKEKDLRDKHLKETKEAYKQLWYSIFSYTSENLNKEVDLYEQQLKRIREVAENGRKPASYGGGMLFEIFNDEVKGDLQKLSEEMRLALSEGVKKGSKTYEDLVQRMKEEIGSDYGAVDELNRWLQVKMRFGEEYVDTFEKLANVIYDINENIGAYKPEEYLNFDNINDDLAVFSNNIEDIKQKYGQLLNRFDESWRGRKFGRPETYDIYEEMYKKQKELLDRQREDEIRSNADWWQKTDEDARKAYEKRLQLAEKDSEEYLQIEREKEEALNRITDEAMNRQTAIISSYEEKQKELIRHKNDERIEDFRGYFNEELQEVRDFYDRMNNIMDKARTPDALGFVNLGKIGKAAVDAEAGLQTANEELKNLYANLYSQRAKMPADLFKNMSKEVLDMIEEIDKKLKELGAEPLRSLSEWTSKFNDYLSNISNYFQDFLSAFQETEDYMIQYQMDALDKENEALEKKLEENEKILERHKEAVDKIEGELSDARGDRKQKLIDALNAEILAQRRAQSEKEKLEKEQERLEKEQQKLEEKQKRNEYERGLQQILFNTAASISQASTTGWPMPAPIYMALAAAVGATQYALARQRKPYAEGGIIDGLSHSNGGVPVGNTGIEVEGGEYVVNRQSTENNRELLNLINTTNRRLSTTDLINFATNMSVSPLEANSPENTSIETAFVAYANRPIWVSVQDINSTQESVRRVEVLSGKRG